MCLYTAPHFTLSLSTGLRVAWAEAQWVCSFPSVPNRRQRHGGLDNGNTKTGKTNTNICFTDLLYTFLFCPVLFQRNSSWCRLAAEFSHQTESFVILCLFCLKVSSQELGHDEFSTQTLARTQREVEEEIQSHRSLIDSLHEQASTLPAAYTHSPQVHTTHTHTGKKWCTNYRLITNIYHDLYIWIDWRPY